jgi:hypothetical protein
LPDHAGLYIAVEKIFSYFRAKHILQQMFKNN